MAQDIFKPAGATKASKPDAGGGVIRNVPVIGIVKNNIDPTRSGRLQVYISDFGSDNPDDSNSWATVSLLTPFYGFVQPTAPSEGNGSFVANPASYGMWHSPPDLETEVICIFVNGDPNYGYYIGAIPKPEALHMVPAIGGSENVITNNSSEAQKYGGASLLPVTNINTNNEAKSDSNNFLDEAKPIHSYQASIYFKQGLIRDKIRGPITSSANRESPSRVGWGVSTPGRPIYQGGFTDETVLDAAGSPGQQSGLQVISRRGGHTFVMDDGDIIGQNNLIRLRSSAGHQITMSDDGQTLFLIHSNGQSYIELGKEGTVDIFSTNSFNVRTQGDLNLHADNNINFHAKKTLNIKAENLNIESEKNTSLRVGANFKNEIVGKYTLKSGGILSISSGDVASYASGGTTFINGSVINLNSGSGPSTESVDPITEKTTTDTLFEPSRGYLAAPGQLKTIVSRAPAHTPWSLANQGVNTEVNPSVKDNTPSEPNPETTSTINSASKSPTQAGLAPAGLATVPPVGAASSSLDSSTTGALVGAAASSAASGSTAEAVSQGAGIVETAQGQAAALGKFAQSPTQLEQAGILKPGSAALVDAMVSSGKELSSALPPNLFTGKDGVNSLESFVGDQKAQINSLVTNIQQTQTSLTNAGLLKGTESSDIMAGMVMAGTKAGVESTLDTVKNSVVNGSLKSLTGTPDLVTNSINQGLSAAKLSQVSTGGLGSIAGAVGALTSAIPSLKVGNNKGITVSAIGAIAKSLAPLPSGVPINLRKLAADNMNVAETVSSALTDTKQTTDLLKLAGRLGGPEVSKITNAVSGGINSVNKLLNAQTTAQTISGVQSVIKSTGAIAGATGNKSIAKTAGQLSSIVGAATNITKEIAKTQSQTTIGQQIGSVSKIAGSLSTVGRILGNKSLSKSASKISSVSQNVGNVLKGVDKLVTSTNVNSSLGALSSIINNAGRITKTLGNSQKASGISMLPGGSLSVGSIVNKSLGKLGIPKNPALSSIITNAVTSSINKIAFPKSLSSTKIATAGITDGLSGSALNAINNAQQDITKSLTDLQTKGTGLAGLSVNDLAPGAAAELNAAMQTIGFGGAGAASLPISAENTFDAADVNSSIDSLLGDPRIPKPDFNYEPDPAGLAALEKLIEFNNEIDSQFQEIIQLKTAADQAREEYFLLESELPYGSPEVEAAKEKYIQAQIDLVKTIDNVENRINY